MLTPPTRPPSSPTRHQTPSPGSLSLAPSMPLVPRGTPPLDGMHAHACATWDTTFGRYACACMCHVGHHLWKVCMRMHVPRGTPPLEGMHAHACATRDMPHALTFAPGPDPGPSSFAFCTRVHMHMHIHIHTRRLASAYEECRAECTGIYLCLEQTVLSIFGHAEAPAGDEAVHDIVYVNWLLMVRAGLTGLEFYTPATGEWRQAHMRAR